MRLAAAACFFVLLAGLCTELLAANSRAQPKAATISLKAKWNSTSALLEAAEFLAEEEPQFLWDFVREWHTRQSDAQESCWERIAQAAQTVLSPAMTKILQISLGVREYSPRLELLRTEAEVAGIPPESCAFVDFGGGQQAHSGTELKKLLKNLEQLSNKILPVHTFDSIFPASESSEAQQVTAVLYGAIGTPEFWEMHQILSAAAKHQQQGSKQIQYVYRPVLLDGCLGKSEAPAAQCFELGTGEQLQLPGFGVEMAIKNMEYSALDDKQVAQEKAAGNSDAVPLEELAGFDFQRLVDRKPELKQKLLEFRDLLLTSASAEETLKVWDLKDIGLQAVQRISQASDPLRSLSDISQTFPSIAGLLSRAKVDPSLRAELRQNQEILPGGATFMIMNGMFLDPQTDLYELVSRIRKDVRLAEQLKGSQLKRQVLRDLLALRTKASSSSSQELRVDLVTANQVTYINDLEKEARYRSWGSSLTNLLQPVFPGTLPRVARNLLTLVLIIDPSSGSGIQMAKVAHDVASSGQWPVRVGIALAPELTLAGQKNLGEDALASWDAISVGEKAASLFHLLAEEEGAVEALAFLSNLRTSAAVDDSAITWREIESAFGRVADEFVFSLGLEEAINQASGTALQQMTQQAAFVASSGLGSNKNSMLLNGLLLPDRGPTLQSKLVYGLQHELQRLQEMIYFGLLEDTEEDVPGFLMRHFKAVPRNNPRISNANGEEAPQLALIGELSLAAGPMADLQYLHPPQSENILKSITHWLVVDLETEEGRRLLREALLYLGGESASENSRLGILQCSDGKAGALSKAVAASMQLPARRAKIPDFLLSLLHSENLASGKAETHQIIELAEAAGLNGQALQKLLEDAKRLAVHLTQQNVVCREKLGIKSGTAAVVTNGRILQAFSENSSTEGLVAADFLLLDYHAGSAQLAKEVADVMSAAMAEGEPILQRQSSPAKDAESEELPTEETLEDLSNAALVASSVLSAYLVNDPYRVQGQADRIADAIKSLQLGKTGFVFPGSADSALEIAAVLDPLSKTAQQLSAVLEFLRATLQPKLEVHLNPRVDISTLPLTSFYRMALPDFKVAESGLLSMPGPPAATFTGLPATKVLTLHMDVPEAWLVEPVRAAHDLDNLRLSDLGSETTLDAEFELEALLLTGTCTDAAARTRDQATPRGVQLHLGTTQRPHVVDTLVMSNLGYFQLKAAPRIYSLQLAPGRSKELYTVLHSEEASTSLNQVDSEATSLPVIIDSLQGKHQRLRLQKRPGFEDADVLEDPEQGAVTLAPHFSLSSILSSWPGGLFKGVSDWFGSSSKGSSQPNSELSPEDDPETIHIFTIASGHMYERLQKIMILSLIRRTRNRVKVWFIKNYMSPQMKRFLPHMAKHYGFEYEFVTYKWPSWLHKQTDKQRIIWAYKILFLDVLFPLNLKKVIFVDSDQIMRADFKELWNMDLKGAPMAYTPFCDNNRDMDGFRFWKQGFWKEHLRGRPYHISALYVVDLARFRQMAAGDQLRIIYEQLSKDPNSLANLDQDLPNYAQSSVPIYSLPQEWLWCETWCGNETKQSAKTIDLCNNPLTKEPKLKGARRIVAEWPALDEEAQAFTLEVEKALTRQALESGDLPESEGLSLSSQRQEEALGGDTDEQLEREPEWSNPTLEQRKPAHDPSEL